MCLQVNVFFRTCCESLVTIVPYTFCENLSWCLTSIRCYPAQEIQREKEYCPVCAEPRRKEWCVVWNCLCKRSNKCQCIYKIVKINLLISSLVEVASFLNKFSVFRGASVIFIGREPISLLSRLKNTKKN